MCGNVAAKCAFYSGFSLNTICIFIYCQRKVALPAEQRSFNQRIIAHPANLIALYMNQCLADQAHYFSPRIVSRIPKQRAQAQHASKHQDSIYSSGVDSPSDHLQWIRITIEVRCQKFRTSKTDLRKFHCTQTDIVMNPMTCTNSVAAHTLRFPDRCHSPAHREAPCEGS